MSDSPQPDPPTGSTPLPPTTIRSEDTQSPLTGGGCAQVVGVFAGFFLFLIFGWAVLAASRSGTVLTLYVIAAFALAIWLATKRDTRGLSVGIFLGLGLLALVWSICSGTRF